MPFTPEQTRRYIFASPEPGLKVTEILEVISRAGAPGDGRVVISLPKNIPGEVRFEILNALRRAYRYGREDHALDAPPEETTGSQDLGAAWDGGAIMARAVHGHDPDPGEHVHVQRTRYVHSHDGGTAEHSHSHPHGSSEEPREGPSGVVRVPPRALARRAADRWVGGLETAQALRPSLLDDGVPEFLDGYDDFHVHQGPDGRRWLHAHDGGPAEHEHRSES